MQSQEASESPAPATETRRETGAEGDDNESNKSPASSASMEKERQIPVDPVSLRQLGMVADADSPLSAPSVLTEMVAQSSPLLPPLRRPTFVGASLPCSAASSPVHSAAKPRGDEHRIPAATRPSLATVTALRSLARQHSAALAHYVAAASPSASPAPVTLSRSVSRAEGRSMAPHDDKEDVENGAHPEESFTCGALCMFIPGFSRKKPGAGAAAVVSSMQRQQSAAARRPRSSVVSRLALLERFECGSWSPPPPPQPTTVVTAAYDDVASFALGAAKISSCAADDDAEAPVKMALVFEGEPPTPWGVLMMKKSASQRQEPVKTMAACGGEPRGILKKSASTTASRRQQDSAATPRASSASQRHVRFSTASAASPSSSPCTTPRLARARAEFNAFMEAQMA